MAPFAGFAQVKDGTACNDFAAVLKEYLQQVFKVAKLRLAVNQGHHVHTKRVLQLRLLVQVVKNHFGYFTALEFNHQAHTGLVRLVLNMADAFNLLLVNQFCHAFLQSLFVDLVRQLVNDDGLACAFVNVFKMALGPHHDFSTPRAVAVFDAVDAVNNARRRKVGGGNDLHELVNRGFGVAQEVQTRVYDFV